MERLFNYMKKIFLLALVATILTACDKGDDGFVYDINRLVTIQGVDRPTPQANERGLKVYANGQRRLTAKEVCKASYDAGTELWLCNPIDFPTNIDYYTCRGFGAHQIDTINDRLYMNGTDILREYEIEGIVLITEFLNGYDMYIRKSLAPHDTIAYLPNARIEAVRDRIFDAYDNGDYERIYTLFDSAFVFYPCTGAEFKALKERGEN